MEIFLESLPQALLQIILVSYEGLTDDFWQAALRVMSIIFSIVSVVFAFYKLCTSSPVAKRRGVTFKNLFCFWEHYICCYLCINSQGEWEIRSRRKKFKTATNKFWSFKNILKYIYFTFKIVFWLFIFECFCEIFCFFSYLRIQLYMFWYIYYYIVLITLGW